MNECGWAGERKVNGERTLAVALGRGIAQKFT